METVSATYGPEMSRQNKPLMKAARELEASFLSSMLEASGLGKPPDLFNGGAGEDHFGSFLRDLHARHMVDAGGIGLAEMLFESLKGLHHD